MITREKDEAKKGVREERKIRRKDDKKAQMVRQEANIVFLANSGSVFCENKLKWQIGTKMHLFPFFKRV